MTAKTTPVETPLETPRPTPGEAPRSRGMAGLMEFVRFVATGSIAALSNLVARYLLNFIMPFEIAVVAAYLVGMVIAFFLFQRMIFGNPDTPLKRRVVRFCQVNLLGLALAEATSVAVARWLFPAIDWTFRPLDVAHVIGVAVPAFSSYFLHKYYTFR
ncbi:MAG: GtrA family protein [Alphaproteobacteria bacterium]